VKFSGKIGGKRLKSGKYVLRVQATDVSGNASGFVSAKFKVR
jgi:hypothetical protein